MSGQILTTADLIFPSSSGNFSNTLSSLKRSRLSIKNRLSSIVSDSKFVQSIAAEYSLPLVANERCGSWYIPPENKSGSVYFKSTDGHQGQWKFSTRRLNLQLLEIVGKYGGCVVVDSTRRGKLMPDALSKTIPVWCAVMNRYLFPDEAESHALAFSGQVVSASEASQIELRLEEFVRDLRDLGLGQEELRARVGRPLRPYFVAPEMNLPENLDEGIRPIVCCSASRRERGDNDDYIQGAGDDNEHWSQGLTSSMFWEARNRFSAEMSEGQLEEIIDELVSTRGPSSASQPVHTVYEADSGNTSIDICTVETLNFLQSKNFEPLENRPYAQLITCDIGRNASSAKQLSRHTIHLDCFGGKNGSRLLRKELPKVDPVLNSVAAERSYKILVSCETGRDLSVGVALAVACRLECAFVGEQSPRIDKGFIRQRLAAITAKYPLANPSRATLQSVNAHLMQQKD